LSTVDEGYPGDMCLDGAARLHRIIFRFRVRTAFLYEKLRPIEMHCTVIPIGTSEVNSFRPML